jgi:hypothetical protein
VRLRQGAEDIAVATGGKARQQEAMELHGTIVDNLQAAVASAKRLRGHPVHKDTVTFWQDLIAQARVEVHEQTQAPEIESLIVTLEGELADRRST